MMSGGAGAPASAQAAADRLPHALGDERRTVVMPAPPVALRPADRASPPDMPASAAR